MWLPGARRDIADIVRCLDVFVLPSLSEGISNTVLEAMATGVPVIATAVGGNSELVEDGRTGRLIGQGDVTALASQIAQYAEDPALRREHGANARQVAKERFSLDRMVGDYQRVYGQLLDRQRQTPL